MSDMFKNFFILTIKGIRYRSTRSWLTILGVVIGVMLVAVILSLGSGIQATVSGTLQMFGSDLIIIIPGGETNPLVSVVGGKKFRERDLYELEKISGVELVIPREIVTMNIEYRGEKKTAMVHAASLRSISQVFEGSQGIQLKEGKWPSDDQLSEVVMGSGIAGSLFQQKVRLGDEVILKSKRMKVVGITSVLGDQFTDNIVFMSMDMFRLISGTQGSAVSAFVKTAPGVNMALVEKQIKASLGMQDVVSDFSVLTPEKASRLVGGVLGIIELALIFIALISLLVGAVGIMNTMYTSVLERTRQIGIMKAIGASGEAILLLFLIESGVIGLIGGTIGVILGVCTAWLVGIFAGAMGAPGLFSFANLDFLGFTVVLVVTFITGVVSGVLPARHAARMEPAEALRR